MTHRGGSAYRERHSQGDSTTTAYAWYALEVKANMEWLVQAILDFRGYEVFLPARSNSDWMPSLGCPSLLFNGYVFAKFALCSCPTILKISGIRKIVSSAGVPVSIDGTEIRSLQTAARSGLAVRASEYISTGRRAVVCEGALTGAAGIVPKGRQGEIAFSVHVIRKSVTVEVPVQWLRPLS